MGFSILFTIIVMLCVFIFTKRNMKATLIAILPAMTIGALLCIFVTAYFYCIKPDLIMEEIMVNVNKETYNPHYILLNDDTISYIKDIDGNIYSFSYKFTPVSIAENSYLEITQQTKIAKIFLYSVPNSYKLFLEKDV